MKTLKIEAKRLPFLAVLASLVLGFVASCNDGALEEAGEDADEAIEEVEDAVDGE